MTKSLLFFITLYFAGFYPATNSIAASGNFIKSNNGAAKIRAIASYNQDHQQKNQPPQLNSAVHFKLKRGWTIYAPGDYEFSNPPTFDFSNSDNLNLEKINIIWPPALIAEEKIGNSIISYAVYKKEVVIPIELEAKNYQKAVTLNIEVSYGLCKDICIPVTQKLTLKIPALEKDDEALQLIQSNTSSGISATANNRSSTNSSKISNSNITLISALIIAFIGGLILNIMPCVLPVLSIKLLGIVSHRNKSVKKIREVYLATTAGIIFSFLALAATTSALKLLGNSLGWGFQFQNPYFLIFLIIILIIFTANLLDMFQIHYFFSFFNNFLNKKIIKQEKEHHIFIPNFLSGILVVLLATPCSAPFLGTAISFALSQNILKIFLTFTAMAIGLAFPYLILIIFPGAINLLPQPGNWMNKVKHAMAGLLIAAIIWLVWVLGNNIGFIPSLIAALFATLILAFFKINNKFHLSSWSKIIIFVTIICCTFIIPYKAAEYVSVKEREYNKLWIKFDQSKISSLVATGNVVVIDITADWCITCKLNKSLVLNSEEIMTKLKEPNIIAMRGDLTVMDEKIMSFMRSHNRYAIPFNIVYGPNAPQGLLTSELLNKKELLEIINNAAN